MATAAPSAVRRVLTLMLPVWAPWAVVSLPVAPGDEVRLRWAPGGVAASAVGRLGKYPSLSRSLGLAPGPSQMKLRQMKEECLHEVPSPPTRREWGSPCLGSDFRALAAFCLVAGDCRGCMFDYCAVGLCWVVPASSYPRALAQLIPDGSRLSVFEEVDESHLVRW
ncbi:hypothetical protein J2S89_002762 [Arthrobacter bambusae]|nr:hypothetical protein [Arthrobacter bambusae]MDQ0099288.1 hypothetical protein [Arthrobacter bambusae]